MLISKSFYGKSILTTGFGVLFLLIAVISSINAEQLSIDYSINQPIVEKVAIGAESYDRIIIVEAPNGGDINAPSMPATGAQILLPFGSKVESIEIITGERILLGKDFKIEPNQQPIPLSADPADRVIPIPDKAIYESDQLYPENLFENIGTYGFRGYQILILKLHPVQYLPSTGELFYYPDLSVVVNTVAADKSSNMFRSLPADENEVLTRVDNPDLISTYAGALKSSASNYDLLIITTPGLAASFQPLKAYHDTTGILTEIHTTDEIGSTNPDDVRAYIKLVYLNDGIRYVLIGGDDDLIPSKDMYVVSYQGGYIDYDMPTDLFFGCLDGPFNNDGDSQWGEPNDGEGGGDVDLIAEVFIGRATAGNITEANRFVTKHLSYVSRTDDHLDDILLCGEYLGFGGVSDYAANSLEELIGVSVANGYYTVGFPESDYTIDQLFDRDWPGNDWPSSELANRINSGLHIIDHFGHGNTSYALKYNSSEIMSAFTNTELFFLYSQACYSGRFDGTDGFAEYMTIKSDHAAFALVMNARYGWGVSESTDGASQRFNREFWDAVYNPAEAKTNLGWANHKSKEDNLYRINESCMRWCYYETNLLGDPAVAFLGVDSCIDADADLICDIADNCPGITNADQLDTDNDGIGDLCDECTDTDKDGYGNPGFPLNTCPEDNCPDISNLRQFDTDNDGIGDRCDDCTDSDGDGYGDPEMIGNTCPNDNCMSISNPDQADTDNDGIGDMCDACTDTDGDGFGDPGYPSNTCAEDNCPVVYNPDQADFDGDGYPDSCDNCPEAYNPDQTDMDSDGYADSCDNCLDIYNPDQADSDDNGIGDLCDGCCQNRGNADGIIHSGNPCDVADLVYLVNYIFKGGAAAPCEEEGNADAQEAGGGLLINVADLTYLVNYLFKGGNEPPPCIIQ